MKKLAASVSLVALALAGCATARLSRPRPPPPNLSQPLRPRRPAIRSPPTGRALHRRCREGPVRLFGRVQPGELGQCDLHHRGHRRDGGADQRDRHRKDRRICARGGEVRLASGPRSRHEAQARHPAQRHRSPAPTTPGAATELATIQTGIQSQYGKGRGTLNGKPISGSDIEAEMGNIKRTPKELAEMWTSWHDNVGAPMKNDYAKMVEHLQRRRQGTGLQTMPARCGGPHYDMPPEQFRARKPSACGRR